jgi:hypothetical protein
LIWLLDEDLDKPPQGPSEVFTFRIAIKLCNLFDFWNTHWIAVQQQSVHSSFADELEWYDLLSADGAGEAICDFGLDKMASSILTT